jgi:hypothetical protein
MKFPRSAPVVAPAFPLLAAVALTATGILMAQDTTLPDRYTAVTANMMPSGVTLRVDITRWSSDEERKDVVAALNGADDPAAALLELPAVGVVWRSGSAVGTRVKYAQRQTTEEGDERVTLVTDRVLGPSFRPWTVDGSVAEDALAYTVIEMNLPAAGAGTGTLSLSATVVADPESMTVALVRQSTDPALLTDVVHVPKPYWAEGG